jgi:RNA polymerase sigma-70 factor (ECF subfamily)
VGRRADRQKLRQLREGRREAWEAAVSQHYKSIYRFLAYLTRDTGLAEDLTQETFASAWSGMDGYKARASFKTWLHRIAYHKFIDGRRRLRREAALLTGLEEASHDAPETSDPLARLAADERLRLLYDAVQRLKSSEHLVIVLHYIQGLSFREMSEVLEAPVGTVKWQTSRALKSLKQYLTTGVQS